MLYYTIRVLLTTGLIVLIGEVSKRSNFLGALLVSLPLTSLFVMVWMYIETRDAQKVVALSNSVLWLVLPSLVLFLLLPVLIKSGWGFWLSLTVSAFATAACYGIMIVVLKQFGIQV